MTDIVELKFSLICECDELACDDVGEDICHDMMNLYHNERMYMNGYSEVMKSSGSHLNVGLYNLEPHIHNSAMMQVAQYEREREHYMGL